MQEIYDQMEEEDEDDEDVPFIVRFIRNSTTLRQDILICCGITFACAMFGFEGTIDRRIMTPVRLIASLLMIANWLRCSWSSGKHRYGGFLLFTGIYWLVPAAAAFFAGAGNPDSTFAKVIAETASVLVFYPFRFFSDVLHISQWLLCAVMFCSVTAAYIIAERIFSHHPQAGG